MLQLPETTVEDVNTTATHVILDLVGHNVLVTVNRPVTQDAPRVRERTAGGTLLAVHTWSTVQGGHDNIVRLSFMGGVHFDIVKGDTVAIQTFNPISA